MRNKKILYFIFFLCIIGITSCQSDDEGKIVPSESQIKVEGEGDEFDIQLNTDDWHIAGIVNKDGNMRIFGDIYTLDNKKIKENTSLELDGLGKLESYWGNKGFSITRDELNSIHISVRENSTGKSFSFGIILQNETDTREIIISQSMSQGYSFAGIEYYLQEEDGDSLYQKRGTGYELNYLTPGEIGISPFGGIDIMNTSYFESEDNDAFVWLKDDSVKVNIPYEIFNERVILSPHKGIYGVVTRIPYENDTKVTMTIPAGKTRFYVMQEWRRTKVSYQLTLTNNRTGQEKVMTGKWIGTTPTGNYEVIREE